MKLTRRTFVAGSIGTAVLASVPVVARAASQSLLVANPALLTAAPPSGTIAASGPELLAALLPLMNHWHRIEAVLDDADMEMFAQLVRFRPGLRLSTEWAQAGCATAVGILHHSARMAIATCDTRTP